MTLHRGLPTPLVFTCDFHWIGPLKSYLGCFIPLQSITVWIWPLFTYIQWFNSMLWFPILSITGVNILHNFFPLEEILFPWNILKAVTGNKLVIRHIDEIYGLMGSDNDPWKTFYFVYRPLVWFVGLFFLYSPKSSSFLLSFYVKLIQWLFSWSFSKRKLCQSLWEIHKQSDC